MGEVEINIKLKDVQDVSQLVKFINTRTLPNNRIKWSEILITSFLFLIISCVLWILPIGCNIWKIFLAFASILAGGYNAVLIYVKWENEIATCIIGVCLLVIFLVAIDVIPLDSIANEIWEITKKIIGESKP